MSEQEKKNHVSVRLAPRILDRVNALIPQFTASSHVGTRSDVVRALILGGLERHEGGGNAELLEREETVGPLGRRADDR